MRYDKEQRPALLGATGNQPFQKIHHGRVAVGKLRVVHEHHQRHPGEHIRARAEHLVQVFHCGIDYRFELFFAGSPIDIGGRIQDIADLENPLGGRLDHPDAECVDDT